MIAKKVSYCLLRKAFIEIIWEISTLCQKLDISTYLLKLHSVIKSRILTLWIAYIDKVQSG